MSVIKEHRSAFTLIEVVLAISVFALGVLTVAGLFANGVDVSTKIADQTRIALFVDGIIGGLRHKQWDEITNASSTVIKHVAEGMWENAESLVIDGNVHATTNYYTSVDGLKMEFFPMQYKVDIQNGQMVKKINVFVWPHTYGQALSNTAEYYSTEIYNFSSL